MGEEAAEVECECRGLKLGVWRYIVILYYKNKEPPR